jgi:hypothetical protein
MPRYPGPTDLPIADSRPIGWFAYLRGHFRQTRGPLAFGLAAAILLAPLLSLVKPVVGREVLAALPVVVAVLAALVFATYVVRTTKTYFTLSDRRLREDETSGLAILAWWCLWLAVGVGPVTFAEWHAPPNGWLVEFVPELHEEQIRWLGVAGPPAISASAPPVGDDAVNPFEMEDEAGPAPTSASTSAPTSASAFPGTPAAKADSVPAANKDEQNPFELEP